MATKILLVDDEKEFRETLAKLLGRRGYDVLVAGDGSQALGLFLQGGVEAVILDMKMPGLHGIETLREIKRLDPAAEVIILTGHLVKSTEQEGLRLGAFAYLTKPCGFQELLETIETALRKRRAGMPGDHESRSGAS